MNRPKILHVGGVLYWTIRTRNPDTQVLKDADSTPTVTVRKNGASTGDSVTITKRSATTGIYDCSYNPAGEVEGDEFTIEETVTVTGTTTSQATYSASWEFVVIAVERGTDGANTTTPPTASVIADAVWDEATSGHTTAGTYGGRIVRATNSNVEVLITGSNHIAADVHEFQNGVIEATDFAAGAITSTVIAADAITSSQLAASAVTEIQSGLATTANQTVMIDGIGFMTSVLMGSISDAGTAGETTVISFAGSTYTVDYSGLDAIGNRSTTTRTKT